ncbi:MAG: HAD-IIIA family hydrolase [Solirubrobacterales bacterium]|nr:HAD-IIIA family hydrolase [Solirubrobacterales bacterium]
MSRPAVFLDRDGVLNFAPILDGKPRAPATLADVQVLPGVPRACAVLRDAGYPLICATNQPDIDRGTADPQAVAQINGLLQELLGLTEVVICPHDDAENCRCRKPKPGMLTDAAARHDLDLSRSVMVGDRWRDIAAGQAAGTGTVFIDRGYQERQPERPDLIVKELEEATEWIIHRLG